MARRSGSATAAPAAGTSSGRGARITRSRGNVLFELDGEPALDLYERYLGEDEAQGLPGTALLFPLRIRDPERPDHDIVRTVLAVDREARSMTFAGDVPEGWVAQLMRGNFDRLAAGAAKRLPSRRVPHWVPTRAATRIAVLVSCIGRRLLMGQHTTDEVEAAGRRARRACSAPRASTRTAKSRRTPCRAVCELHNQTMTVTTIAEEHRIMSCTS